MPSNSLPPIEVPPEGPALGSNDRNILEPSWYARSPREVAPSLIGMRLVRVHRGRRLTGIIVETEAYLAEQDPAAHSARGETPSNRSMFQEAGIAYVYPIHARFCFNVVTERPSIGSAVLIRAVQPESGVHVMLQNRAVDSHREIANGPAKLCQAMAIDRSQDGNQLIRANGLWIERPHGAEQASGTIKRTVRIGVTSAKSLPLRFVLKDSKFASGPLRLRS